MNNKCGWNSDGIYEARFADSCNFMGKHIQVRLMLDKLTEFWVLFYAAWFLHWVYFSTLCGLQLAFDNTIMFLHHSSITGTFTTIYQYLQRLCLLYAKLVLLRYFSVINVHRDVDK